MKLRQLSAFVMVSLGLASVFGSGCQSIIGIEDRSYEAPVASAGEGGSLDPTGGKDGGGGMVASGGSAGSGAGETGDSGSGGGPELSPCEEYCQLVDQNCKNDCPDANPACPRDLRVYSSTTICMNVCAKMDPGDPDDPTGNTLACRLQQARFAKTISDEAWVHCPAAGPGGNGVCGDNCESYCSMMDDFCAEDFPEFIDEECERKCRGLRDVGLEPGIGASDSAYGANLHHDGDFLQCRLVHVSSASEAPIQHCWHAALEPKPLAMALNPCADPKGTEPRCADYCRLVMVSCPDDLAVYTDVRDCLSACEGGMDLGDAVDDAGMNTVGCRKNHAYNAMKGDPATHCPHAGPGGNGVCGANCDSYCRLLEAACEEDFTTVEACLSECEELDGSAKGSAYAVEAVQPGNNFQCRLRAVVSAFENPDNCEAALGAGECAN